VREGVVVGEPGHPVEQVIVAERPYLDELVALDQPHELGVIVGRVEVLLAGGRHLDGQEPLAVRIVPQLGRHGDLRRAPHRPAARLLHLPRHVLPGLHPGRVHHGWRRLFRLGGDEASRGQVGGNRAQRRDQHGIERDQPAA
jgi:hypothetical protein